MPGAAVSEQCVLQDDFDNDVDALLEEGLCAPKKRRMEEKYGGDSDHPSDGETSVQPMMTKIKTVLKSKSGQEVASVLGRMLRWESPQAAGRQSGRPCVSAGRRVLSVTGSLECEDTPYALPWCGKGASGRVEAADRGSAECGGCSWPLSEFSVLCRVLGKLLEAGRTHSTVCAESRPVAHTWAEVEGSWVHWEERLGCLLVSGGRWEGAGGTRAHR